MGLKISYSWVCFAARLQTVQNAERLPIAECHSKLVKFLLELRNRVNQIPVWVIVPSELNLASIHSVSCNH